MPISKAVHLSRLAAGHAACAECAYREETSTLPEPVTKRVAHIAAQSQRSVLSYDGIYGRFQNEMTRQRIADIGTKILTAAVAISDDPDEPRVAIGRDSRPSSPELSIALVDALRRSGCAIADVGQASRGCFDFAVRKLNPTLGLFITGGSRGLEWNGLSVVDGNGIAWTNPGRLADCNPLGDDKPVTRLSRTPGIYQAVFPEAAYRAQLEDALHAVRPFRLVIACPDSTTREILRQQFDETPCSLHLVDSELLTSESLQRQVSETIVQGHCDLGIVMSRDGHALQLFDDRGRAVIPQVTLQLIGRAIDQLTFAHFDDAVQDGLIAASHPRTAFGNAAHHFWVHDGGWQSDPIANCTKLLQVLSRSGQSLSAMIDDEAD